MAGYIRGITIEFGADTTKLNNALQKTQGTINKTQSELKQVNTALQFNPRNATLLGQKFDLLKQKVDETRTKLDGLKDLQQEMDANGVEENSAQYRELQREIIKTEDQLKDAEKELKQFGSVGKQQAIAVGEEFKKAGKKISSMGQTWTTNITMPLTAGFALSANLASDYEENLNKIDVAFGKSSDEVKAWAETAGTQFGLSKVQATSAASSFGALGKGIGLSEGEAAKMSTSLAGLSADLGSYFNVGTDESSKALEGIFTGESEALKKFGVVMTDTNLKKFAEDQGLVYSELSETEKVQLRYNYVLAKTKDAQGDFARTSDGTANSLKLFQAATQDLGTAVGQVLLPIITPIIQKITTLIQKFSEMSPTAQKVITVIALIVAAIGPLLVVVGGIISAIGTIITIAPVLGGAFTALLGPVGLIVAAIAAAIAIGVLLIKNWDKIKAKAVAVWNAIKTAISTVVNKIKTVVSTAFNALKTTVSKVWTGIKNAILTPIKSAMNTVKKVIDKIKGFFKFKVKLPHIKLPHFAIHPKGWQIGDLLKGSIPSLGIDWYAKGGIFNSPSVIGVGEKGPEAVLPIEKLNVMMASMADSIVNGITTSMALSGAGDGGNITIPIYLYPNGAKMGEETVKMYDKYKRILG